MNTRTTYLFLLGALVMGGLLVVDIWKGRTVQDRFNQSTRVVELKSEEVNGFTLVRTNQTITLAKHDDRWRITEPLDVRADIGTVQSMVTVLEFARRSRTITKDDMGASGFSRFGLDKPALKVVIQSVRGPVTLLIGAETGAGDASYVRVEGSDEVLVVDNALRQRLDKSLDDLRDRDVLDINPEAVSRVEMKMDQRILELARMAVNGGGISLWRIAQPLAARADQARVSSLLTDLDGLRAQRYISENPADTITYNLDEPRTEITLRTAAVESSVTLLLGDAVPSDNKQVYAKLKNVPSIFTLNAADVAKLTPAVSDLRDTHVLVFDESKVRAVDLVNGADKISFRRDGTDKGGWVLTSPVAMAAEEAAVNALFRLMRDLAAREFVDDVATDLSKYGLMSPAATATFLGEGTNVLAQLLIGDPRPETTHRYVKSAVEPFVYAVDTVMLDIFMRNPLILRSRLVTGIDPSRVTKVAVTKPSGRTVVERGADGGWKLVEPAQGVLDTDALRAVIQAIGEMRADDLIQDSLSNLEKYGLDEPEMSFAIYQGDQFGVLNVGGATPGGGKYLSWNNPPLVFSMSVAHMEPVIKNLVTSLPSGAGKR